MKFPWETILRHLDPTKSSFFEKIIQNKQTAITNDQIDREQNKWHFSIGLGLLHELEVKKMKDCEKKFFSKNFPYQNGQKIEKFS